MFDFCAICMVKRVSLVQLNKERRRFVEALVSPFINLESLKCRVLICTDCNRLLITMLKFQQTVLKGVKNLLALHKRKKVPCHNLPEVINGQCDVLLPVASEEVVYSSDLYHVDAPLGVGSGHPVVHVMDFSKASDVNILTEINKKFKKSTRKSCKKVQDLDSSATMSCDSDFDAPDTVPGYEPVITNIKFNEHAYVKRNMRLWQLATPPRYNDMAVLVPMQNGTDNTISTNTNKSSEVRKTKVNRQLYKAIKLALESRSISDDFNISQYEPESESGSELESVHSLECLESNKSDSTLSGESDYEDAENFPNIILAKAFSGFSKDVHNEISEEDIKKKSHVVLNPPSEWPCSWERCQLRHSSDSDSDGASDVRTSSPVKLNSRRRRKKCKLCHKLFASLLDLWTHYEREHVDICKTEFFNRTELKKLDTKVTEKRKARWPYSCAECGVDFRSSSDQVRHVATHKHQLRTQWRFQCDICQRKFEDKKRMAEHIQQEHLAKEGKKCPMCSSAFHSARALIKHAAAHVLAQDARREHTSGVRDTRKRPHDHTTHTDSPLTNGTIQKRPRKTQTANTRNHTQDLKIRKTQRTYKAKRKVPGKRRKKTQNSRKRKVKLTQIELDRERVDSYLKRNVWVDAVVPSLAS